MMLVIILIMIFIISILFVTVVLSGQQFENRMQRMCWRALFSYISVGPTGRTGGRPDRYVAVNCVVPHVLRDDVYVLLTTYIKFTECYGHIATSVECSFSTCTSEIGWRSAIHLIFYATLVSWCCYAGLVVLKWRSCGGWYGDIELTRWQLLAAIHRTSDALVHSGCLFVTKLSVGRLLCLSVCFCLWAAVSASLFPVYIAGSLRTSDSCRLVGSDMECFQAVAAHLPGCLVCCNHDCTFPRFLEPSQTVTACRSFMLYRVTSIPPCASYWR